MVLDDDVQVECAVACGHWLGGIEPQTSGPPLILKRLQPGVTVGSMLPYGRATN